MKKLGKKSKTARGFALVEFKDRYDTPCSLQQSSLAEYEIPGTSAIWLGVDGEKSRMHLDRKQVGALIGHLQHWLEDGQFS